MIRLNYVLLDGNKCEEQDKILKNYLPDQQEDGSYLFYCRDATNFKYRRSIMILMAYLQGVPMPEEKVVTLEVADNRIELEDLLINSEMFFEEGVNPDIKNTVSIKPCDVLHGDDLHYELFDHKFLYTNIFISRSGPDYNVYMAQKPHAIYNNISYNWNQGPLVDGVVQAIKDLRSRYMESTVLEMEEETMLKEGVLPNLPNDEDVTCESHIQEQLEAIVEARSGMTNEQLKAAGIPEPQVLDEVVEAKAVMTDEELKAADKVNEEARRSVLTKTLVEDLNNATVAYSLSRNFVLPEENAKIICFVKNVTLNADDLESISFDKSLEEHTIKDENVVLADVAPCIIASKVMKDMYNHVCTIQNVDDAVKEYLNEFMYLSNGTEREEYEIDYTKFEKANVIFKNNNFYEYWVMIDNNDTMKIVIADEPLEGVIYWRYYTNKLDRREMIYTDNDQSRIEMYEAYGLSTAEITKLSRIHLVYQD